MGIRAPGNMHMKTLLAITLAAGFVAGAAQAATVYTQDGNLADFTNGVTDYATFSNFRNGNAPDPSDPGSHNNTDYTPGFTYTPTTGTTEKRPSNQFKPTFPLMRVICHFDMPRLRASHTM